MNRLKYLLLAGVVAVGLSPFVLHAHAQTSNAGTSQNAPSAQSTSPNTGSAGASGQMPEQNAGIGAQAGTSSESGTASSGTASENNQSGAQEQNQNRLPRTASPLPLVAALGLASFGIGLIARRRKTLHQQ